MTVLTPVVWMPILGLVVGFVLGLMLSGALKPLIERMPEMLASDAQTQRSTHAPWLVFALCNAALWWGCAAHWGTLGVTLGGTHEAPWHTALAWAVFSTGLLALAWIDWQTTFLPDMLTQPLLWGGLIASAQGWIEVTTAQAVWGAVLGYGSLWLTAHVFERVTGKVGMGGGDFKLLAAMGAWLGPWALWPLLFMASTAGALVGVVMQRRNALREDGYLPFGPFLAGSGLLMAYGDVQIFSWVNGSGA